MWFFQFWDSPWHKSYSYVEKVLRDIYCGPEGLFGSRMGQYYLSRTVPTSASRRNNLHVTTEAQTQRTKRGLLWWKRVSSLCRPQGDPK